MKRTNGGIFENFRAGFFAGLGWAFGATVGFALVSALIILFVGRLGGIPLIGEWLASIVEATLEQLSLRTPIFGK